MEGKMASIYVRPHVFSPRCFRPRVNFLASLAVYLLLLSYSLASSWQSVRWMGTHIFKHTEIVRKKSYCICIAGICHKVVSWLTFHWFSWCNTSQGGGGAITLPLLDTPQV
ncbi:hypothetical protein XELAEV_18014746mg [Xenopus laevis]|uniref:Uncharacterized protein n=1 Tax=Xenopus laevis TaxID=8355 RepID=A0A974DJ13_XENLA|nr:hypothetical protein XELAEV_18014746mg [Xenopus laevis]